MLVKCPTCRKPVEYDETHNYRPFCSERCQVLDLGAWADERYRVPVNEKSDGEPALNDENPKPDELN